jgi:hypothetical protein
MALKIQENTGPRSTASTNGPERENSAVPDDALESWKQIAAFLARDERTAMRWEKEQGMPVRRIPGKRGRVYASRAEISAWLRGSASSLVSQPLTQSLPPRARSISKKHFLIFAVLCVLVTVLLLSLTLAFRQP